MLVGALTLLATLQAAPPGLNEATFAAVRDHAKPSATDLSFQRIDWKESIFEGLVESQKQDKPLLLWLYFGDPRGHC